MKESVKTKWMISWRIVVATGMISLFIFTVMFGYMFYQHELKDGTNRTWTESSEYSDKYIYEHTTTTVRLKEVNTGKYLTPELSTIFTDNIKDSITVFFHNEKRGFLNVYTGEVVVPAKFDRAWVFSEGLGAVVMDSKVGFVNSKGEFIIPCQYNYLRDYKNKIDFLFKDGFCTVTNDNGKHGLIDKTGKWVVDPEYDYINKPVNGFRIIQKGDNYGLLDSTLTLRFPIKYSWVTLNKEGALVTHNGVQQLIAYDGKTVLQPLVINSSEELWYQTDHINSECEHVSKLSTYRKYLIPNGCGLLDTQNNKIKTLGIYKDIQAITNELFECELQWPNTGSVLINSKGEILNNTTTSIN